MIEIYLKDIDIIATINKLYSMNYTTFLSDTGDWVTEQIQKRMEAGIDPDGKAQPENVGQYAKWKKAIYPGEPPGMLTGSLKESLHGIVAIYGDEVNIEVGQGKHPLTGWRFDKGNTYMKVAQRLELGEPYSSYPRPFLGINDKEAEIIYERFCSLFSPEFE